MQPRNFLILSLLICSVIGAFDIMSYGAIPNSDNVQDHFQNAKALKAAI